MASELRALMDSDTVRLLDLVLLTKDADGSVEASELRDADDSEVGQLRAAEADLAVLLAESDVEEIGQVLEPGSSAAVLVWENTWAGPFGAAVRRSWPAGGQRSHPDPGDPGRDGRGPRRRSGRGLTCRCAETEVTGRVCSAEFATGVMTGGTGAMIGKTTRGTGAMTGKTAVAGRDCSGNREARTIKRASSAHRRRGWRGGV
jgi:hypothetical protein